MSSGASGGSSVRSIVAVSKPSERSVIVPVGAMMALYFLIVLTVGILRPVRASLALDGLASGGFYQVYLVSAAVIGFVPLLNRLSDFAPWQRLIPAMALFFASNLLIFRAVYVEGSTLFGFAFYGWYDLFVAVLVTQFFMVTQLFFHAGLARNAYPLVIAAGSIGATLGAGLSGFLAERLGTPNLLLVAAAPVAVFSLAVPLVWSMVKPEAPRLRRPAAGGAVPGPSGRLVEIAADRQVQLIAAMVLIIILVKQIVDYQFQTITKEVFVDRDAVTAFQGKFYAATQWLPLLALVGVSPLLRRWGVGLVVLIFPVVMLLTNVSLVLFWGLWVAVAAKGSETALRYSVERATREILYVPIADELKLKAKNYIDAALERGAGKLASGLVIGLVVGVAGLHYRHVAWLGALLALIWIAMALRVRKEYVKALDRSIDARVATFRGAFAGFETPGMAPAIAKALRGDTRAQAFGLQLLDEAPGRDGIDTLAAELTALLEHPLPAIRERVLSLLARAPDAVDRTLLQGRLLDSDAAVREAAVRAVCAAATQTGEDAVGALLASAQPEIRMAVLTCLARGELTVSETALADRLPARPPTQVDGCQDAAGRTARIERAVTAAALRPPEAAEILARLIDDFDAAVATAALWSAAMTGDARLLPAMVSSLARPATRGAASRALVACGAPALPLLIARLLDEDTHPAVRRRIPAIMAHLPAPATVDALVRCILAPQTDQILDHRAIKALSKLRSLDPGLAFDAGTVQALLDRSLDAARRYGEAWQALVTSGDHGAALPRLLAQAVSEAWAERREEVFRCLGLQHLPDAMHRACLATAGGDTVARANAREWLETTVGHTLFRRLAPVLDRASRAVGATRLRALLEDLSRDEDRWVAHLAARTAAESGLSDPVAAIPPEPKLSTTDHPRSREMNLVETVLLLQQVDVFRDARSDHLALLATIAEEVRVDTGFTLLTEGAPGDALYLVVQGAVKLTGPDAAITIAEGGACGTWSLVDDVPSPFTATTMQRSRLLRINRSDFHDLLAEHPELAIGMLQGLARRVRSALGSGIGRSDVGART
jgi:ATP/ADP translocase